MSGLVRWLGVRPGEGRLVALVAALFAAVEAGRGFGEVGADTLFLSRFGPDALPWLFIGLGLVSLVATAGYGAAFGRLRRGHVLAGVLAAAALLLVAELVAIVVVGSAMLPVAWLTVYAAGMLAMTAGWTVAGSVFDVRQAKRLFPIGTSAAIAGSFAGTLAAGPLARLTGTEWLIAAEAALLAAAAFVVDRIGRDGGGGRLRAASPGRSVAAEIRAGWEQVARSPLLRLIAVAYVLFAVLMFSVTFPFLRAMSEAFDSEADLATALGILSAAVTATSFVVSLLVAPRVYRRLGVATAAAALPVVYLLGFGLWLMQFSVATAALVRVVQQVTQRGLTNGAWSAFYTVVPSERRAQVMAFNDGIPGQVGTALSGVLLLAAGTVMAPDNVFWLGIAAAAICTFVVLEIRRRYAATLLATLRAGLGEQILEGGPGFAALAAEPRVADSLVAGLAAREPVVRQMAAQLLGRLADAGTDAGTDALLGRLDDEDAGVRAAAVDALASRSAATIDLERLILRLDDSDPGVRRAAITTLATLDGASIEERAEQLAGDPSPGVRAALAVALVRRGEEDRPHALLADLLEATDEAARIAGLNAVGQVGGHLPSEDVPQLLRDPSPRVRAEAIRALAAANLAQPMDEAFVAALDDDAQEVRRAAAAALRERPDPAPGVLETLRAGSARAQEAALWALEGHGPAVRAPLATWTQIQVARAGALRRGRAGLRAARQAGPDGADDGALDYLEFLLRSREEALVQRLLRALAVLGAPEAAGPIRRCLRSTDADVRAQAIEALDSIGDAGLRRAIVDLLDDPDREDGRGGLDILPELGDDPDEWVRALALRAQAARVVRDWMVLADRARSDRAAVVRDALAPLASGGGPRLPETSRTVGDLDRMLFLRRVPLFAELEPEDLQRIAASAVERYYPEGEALVREGDLGHEMVIIVDGAVRIVRTASDGSERLLRRYEAGDHIGELALLRERPRAATVIAEPPGVRGLVIGGDGLMALLRERPEAAMAMLATLAERISSQ